MKGEIEKRFKDGSYEQTEQGVVVAFGHPNGIAVMKWIDEAKKDYPQRKKPEDLPRNEKGQIDVTKVTWHWDSYGNEIDGSLIKRRDEWFIKWFGK